MEQQEIQTIERQGAGFIEMANAQLVDNQEDAGAANETLVKLTKGLKQIEEKRKSFTQPINQSLKEINKTFKAITEPILVAKSSLSQRLMKWRTTEKQCIHKEQEAARREEERRRLLLKEHSYGFP